MKPPAFIPIEPCPMDLSVAGLDQAIKQYEEFFGITPNLLVTNVIQHFLCEELLPHPPEVGGMLFITVPWIPYHAWLVTYGNRGIIYSDGA